MKEKISTLMDGELHDESAANVIAELRRSGQLQDEWETYHLIGDILRSPATVSLDITQRIARELEKEPVILAPRSRSGRQETEKKSGMPSVFSVAASITAISAVAWVSLQTPEQTNPGSLHMAVADMPAIEEPIMKASYSPAAPAVAMVEDDGQMDDYLLAHEGFSHQMVAQGVSHYTHKVAAVQENPDR